MPELPEVEFGRTLAEGVANGRRIERAHTARDSIVYHGVTPIRVARHLRGREVKAVHRKGKYIWFELDARPWPIFHFGMTGSFRVPTSRPLALASSPRAENPGWPPRFTKIHLVFEDGGELVMTNARRLGRIRLAEDPEHEPPVNRLGFDPLLSPPSPPQFTRALQRRRTSIKALLLNQGFAAGVGNWIADEVLYQANIDPRRLACSLTGAESRKLLGRLTSIVRRAVEVDADKTRFPRTWLFHRRWGRRAGSTTSSGEAIKFINVAGRTTAWVPARQR